MAILYPRIVHARASAKPLKKFLSSGDAASYLKERYRVQIRDETGGSQPLNVVLQAIVDVFDALTTSSAVVDEAITSYGFQEIVLESGEYLDHGGEHDTAMANYIDDEGTLYIATKEAMERMEDVLTLGVGEHNVGLGFKAILAHEVGHVAQPYIEIAAKRTMAIIYDTQPKPYWMREISRYCEEGPQECFAEAYAAYTHSDYGKDGHVLPPVLVDMFTAAGVQPCVIAHPTLEKAAKTDENGDPVSITTSDGTVIDAATVGFVLQAIKDADWAALDFVLTPDITQAFKDAGYSEIGRVQGFTGDPENLLNVVDQEAVAYASDHAAALVTQITDSTENMLRAQITEALVDGISRDDLASEISGAFAFSEDRAQMIAHTELAAAHSYGRVEVSKEAGAEKKRWLLSADHDPAEDCLCSDAADDGWIDIDDNFADDDDYDFPPGHPNCWCDWESDLNGGDDSGDESDSSDSADSDNSDTAKSLHHTRLVERALRQPRGSRGRFTKKRSEQSMAAPSQTSEGVEAEIQVAKYSPDQPRDDHGRFGSGGGGKGVKIPRDHTLTGHAAEVQERFASAVEANPQAYLEAYAKLPGTYDGKLSDPDIARQLSSEYVQDRSLAPAVHETASWIAKQTFANNLTRPLREGETNHVLLTGGGAGSGKSTGLQTLAASDVSVSSARAIYDGTMSNYASTAGRIAQIQATGNVANVVYTYREPGEAYTGGVLVRAMEQERTLGSGRVVPMKEFVAGHVGSNEVARQLVTNYAGHSDVVIHIIDNSHGNGNAHISNIDNIPRLSYNHVEEDINGRLEAAHRSGAISDAVYQGSKGHS